MFYAFTLSMASSNTLFDFIELGGYVVYTLTWLYVAVIAQPDGRGVLPKRHHRRFDKQIGLEQGWVQLY